MTERKLVAALTEVCEELKQDDNGFCWLTHIGHWRLPTIIAVFNTQAQLTAALSRKWDIDFINRVNIALDTVKSSAHACRFTSEEACRTKNGGDWDSHLSQIDLH
ncbi:hypothetical protein MTsDn1_30400 [Alteromonas sp. MTD1]|uniref:hypothetical protein n=1 Tax=Alteromonas sp. MTD1 TaxID=3057962 RepID=UPI0036F41008